MHKHNSYSSLSISIGGTTPVLCDPKVDKRMFGARVMNTLALNERIAAGTPFEFDLENRQAKFLKSWKIKSVSISGDNTIVTLYRTSVTPVLNNNTILMVMPDTIDGTGKADICGVVTQGENTYVVTLTTASFDALSANKFLVEAKEVGSGKTIYCQPNNISTEDTIGGNVDTLVDVPRGELYMFQNTIPAMPDAVKKSISAGDVHIVWENFNTAKD